MHDVTGEFFFMSKSKIPFWLQNFVRRLAQWVGLETREPVLVVPPTAEDLVGDDPPSDIMKAWRLAVRSQGLDEGKEFVRLFLRGGEYHNAIAQVAWAQAFSRRTSKQVKFEIPDCSNFGTAERSEIAKAFDTALANVPPELISSVRKGFIVELNRIIKESK